MALKAKIEEEERIKEENKRIKEWEDKFDQEQKIKEEELINKFYSDQSQEKNINQINDKGNESSENSLSQDNKEN